MDLITNLRNVVISIHEQECQPIQNLPRKVQYIQYILLGVPFVSRLARKAKITRIDIF